MNPCGRHVISIRNGWSRHAGEGAAAGFAPHALPPPQHLLSQQAAPIQPLDVSAALMHQVRLYEIRLQFTTGSCLGPYP